MTTFAEFANKCQKAAPNLREAQKRGLGAGAFVVKQTIQAQPGYTSQLRGVGKKGAKIGVRYTVLSAGKAAVVFAYGPFHFLERATKPHSMARRTGVVYRKERTADGRRINVKTDKRYERAAKGVVQVIPGVGPRNATGFKQHPGTRGKHPFARGVDVARPLVGRAIHAEMSRGLVKAFK